MGRYLRVMLRLCWLIPLAVVLWTVGYFVRKQEEDQDEDTHDIVEVAPEENTDDGSRDARRVFFDMSPLDRVKKVDEWHHREAALVVPKEPIEEWAARRRVQRMQGAG